MAGSFGVKPNSKDKKFVKNNNSEILKDFHSPSDKIIPKLFGTLFPGQSVEINQPEQPKNNINWAKEFLTVNQEQTVFINKHTQEIEQSINQLRLEIKNLIQDTQELDVEIQQTVFQDTTEFNQYQLNFLERIKILVINFRKNISQSCVWLESLNSKKSKKNAFWGKARNKKNGGEQYLFSGEHSASRSAN
jgi:hypothetical protein